MTRRYRVGEVEFKCSINTWNDWQDRFEWEAVSSERVPEHEQAMILGVQEFVRIRKRFPMGLD